jgi:hypothetical protein
MEQSFNPCTVLVSPQSCCADIDERFGKLVLALQLLKRGGGHDDLDGAEPWLILFVSRGSSNGAVPPVAARVLGRILLWLVNGPKVVLLMQPVLTLAVVVVTVAAAAVVVAVVVVVVTVRRTSSLESDAPRAIFPRPGVGAVALQPLEAPSLPAAVALSFCSGGTCSCSIFASGTVMHQRHDL